MSPIEDVNPLIPAGYDIAWTVVLAVSVAAIVVAVVFAVRWIQRGARSRSR